MAYVKQGPWNQGDPLSADQVTAMDDGIAAARAAIAVDLGTVSGTVFLDAMTGDAFTASLSGAATIQVANLHQDGVLIEVSLFLTANSNTVAFDSSIVFAAGQPGALTGAPDLLRFVALPGTGSIYGRLVEAY